MSIPQLSFENESKFIKGVELFNQKEWYLAHDVFEEVWHNNNSENKL